MSNFPTVRIISKHGECAGKWFVDPGESAKLAYIRKSLAEMQQIEPRNDWHLETCGGDTTWHRWQSEDAPTAVVVVEPSIWRFPPVRDRAALEEIADVALNYRPKSKQPKQVKADQPITKPSLRRSIEERNE